ncbi:MAG TPA: FxLYD domain-containing protein [Ilumatobacter sp.]|nr:FxLYD domain-containing protein [Ilumatobacter sp.]
MNAPATNPTVTSAAATVPAQSSPAESVPIAPAETVTVPPATGGTGDVVIVGSNAFAEDSTLTIDGEGRTLYTVAELRNDGPQTVQVGAITVTIRDAAGTEIGRREDYPIDRVLDPGETTYLYEFTPSMMYWETETNTFPEGWAAFDLAYEVESPYAATEFDDVNLATEQVQVERSGTDVLATGLIRNSTDVAVSSYAELYVALYDAEGHLINVAWTYATPGTVDVLQPGETLPFEVNVWAGPTDYSGAVVGAVATPSL